MSKQTQRPAATPPAQTPAAAPPPTENAQTAPAAPPPSDNASFDSERIAIEALESALLDWARLPQSGSEAKLPSQPENSANPRARAAKLRAAVRTAAPAWKEAA